MKEKFGVFKVNDLVVLGRLEEPYCECGGLKIVVNTDKCDAEYHICNEFLTEYHDEVFNWYH